MVAREATSHANSAKNAAEEARKWIQVMGGAGFLALVGLVAAFFINIQSAYNAISPRVDGVVEKVTRFEEVLSRVNALEAENRGLMERIQTLERAGKVDKGKAGGARV